MIIREVNDGSRCEFLAGWTPNGYPIHCENEAAIRIYLRDYQDREWNGCVKCLVNLLSRYELVERP